MDDNWDLQSGCHFNYTTHPKAMASMMKTFNELRESITMQKFHGRLETIKENETFILTFEILIAENCQNFT